MATVYGARSIRMFLSQFTQRINMPSLLEELQKMGLDQPKRNKAYKVGDIITYWNNASETIRLKVKEREEDVKNGHPGFYGQIIDVEGADGQVWGYDYQVTNVEPV